MNIAIGWSGLPTYAARLINMSGASCPVVATRPKVPIKGMENILGNRLRWIPNDYAGDWAGIGLACPDLYFQPSWFAPAFNHLGDEVRAAGGKVVVMFDNRWRGDLRQIAGAVCFRVQWRKKYAGAWVAGESGRRLARFWGFPAERIYTGMYGADPLTFGSQVLEGLSTRPKRFIFVGRLVEEKGIRDLIKAWRHFSIQQPEWELHVYGTGPLESELIAVERLVFHGFKQPDEIAAGMRNARFLVLPSHEEHWGLVVCEAAQCGCGLLLSENVGSHPDLLTPSNGKLFKVKNPNSLNAALTWACTRSDSELARVMETSVETGLRFTPANWAGVFSQILNDIR